MENRFRLAFSVCYRLPSNNIGARRIDRALTIREYIWHW